MQITYSMLADQKVLDVWLSKWRRLFPESIEADEDLASKCAENDMPLNIILQPLVTREVYADFEETFELASRAQYESLHQCMRIRDTDFSPYRSKFKDRIFHAYVELIRNIKGTE